ncbi:MAG: 3-isopropylmalate dehydrogenase [Dehalococcoidia bacterium]|nr:3-isopropylmalate dehydrogenase [Dehalococcoidia bacterium]
MGYKIAMLPGDGIGMEVLQQALKVIEEIATLYRHDFSTLQARIGGVAIDEIGMALPPETLKLAKRCDAVLLGAVGAPKYDDPSLKERPENGLLALRKGLKLFANLRPLKVYPELACETIFKPGNIRAVDFIFVRELTGGLYFGKPKKRWVSNNGRQAVDTLIYTESEIERIVRVAFELARARRRKLTSVDKANVLESSRLWRQIVIEVAKDYPDITLEHMLVDTCAMRLMLTPSDFDVLVTENMFGDILTDETAVLAGSMGMLPSASLAGIPKAGQRVFGLYEPIHGSAPTIAGKNIANPIAAILSVAMMLRYSFAMQKEALEVEKAVRRVLKSGYRTADISSRAKGIKTVTTDEMGDLICDAIKGIRYAKD